MKPVSRGVLVEGIDSLACRCWNDEDKIGNHWEQQQRRVTFSQISPSIIHTPLLHETDRIWWQRQELTETLHSAKNGSKDFGRRGLLMEGLDQAYYRARRIALAVDDEERLVRRLKNIQVNDALTQWSRYGHSRRGLEKWCSKAQHRVRTEASQQQKSAVLSYDGTSKEELARIAETASRTARIFARMIGEADAIVVSTNSAPAMEKPSHEAKTMCRRLSLPPGMAASISSTDLVRSTKTSVATTNVRRTPPSFPLTAPGTTLRRSETFPGLVSMVDEDFALSPRIDCDLVKTKSVARQQQRKYSPSEELNSPRHVFFPDLDGS